MIELFIPLLLFSIWTVFSILYIRNYKKHQLIGTSRKLFWNNEYIFEAIPPVFPTLGIFCTALGITIGIWDFDTTNIQGSIPLLLKGLRIAFIATMAGIIGLIVFQKYIAIVQKKIEQTPDRPRKQTDELSAIRELKEAVVESRYNNETQIDKLILALETALDSKVSSRLTSFENVVNEHLRSLREEQKVTSETANKNTGEIIKAMGENNKLIALKFDEFSELLKKNNTEALVEVMKNTTEQFNAQMSELINRLVKENFSELNKSVNSLNDWQKENKEQIQKLTAQFQLTTEMFTVSAKTLKDVADHTNSLTADNGKLGQIVGELKRVMIEDGRFQNITNKLSSTVELLAKNTESFDETTAKLNDWIKNERNFKESAQILIVKLEEFRDFNGDIWNSYREEMSKSVAIIKETSTRLSGDLENINAEFYERLNGTLQNLDQCIQRFLPNNPRT